MLNPPPIRRRSRSAHWLVAALLAAGTMGVYWPALENGFTNFDDDAYVTENPQVQGGLSAAGVAWAFTSTEEANWHPLTWLSHMLDCEIWGLDPRGHHLSSVLLHCANAAILLLVLYRMTGALGRSAAVAALFAFHPLRVESVAWVSERKDVLSTLFWFLATGAYVRYAVGRPVVRLLWRAWTRPWFVATIVLFALGLTAKPMLVTLPFTLVLLDLWPLRRWDGGDLRVVRDFFLEKIPLSVLATVSSVVTFVVQSKGGAIGSEERFPLAARIGNAFLSYAAYLRQAAWPSGLAVFYPHPGTGLPLAKAAVSAVAVILVTVIAVRARARAPYVTTGWLWYLGTLVPVIGLVQVGEQAMADRYTYVPSIGILAIVVWGMNDGLDRWLRGRPSVRVVAGRVAAVSCLVVLTALAAGTRFQIRTWRDSFALFERALAVTENNHVAHINLGIAWRQKGDLERAAAEYTQAIEIKDSSAVAHNNLGLIRQAQNRIPDAILHFRAALDLNAEFAEAHNNLGSALAQQGKLEDALLHFAAAARGRPGDASVIFNWGTALARAGRLDDAIRKLREAIRLRPRFGEAHYNLGAAHYFKGDFAEAWREVEIAEQSGFAPPPQFLSMLDAAMPRPE